MAKQDIRWVQQFNNYKKALKKWEDAVVYIKEHFPKEGLSIGGDGIDEVLE